MLPWKRNNSATLWTAQEAVSYLQKNCRNQNRKTFLSVLVKKLVSLFSYRSTCVWIHNHGHELFFSPRNHSSPYTPPSPPALSAYMRSGSLLFCSQTDWLCPCTHTGVKRSATPGPRGCWVPSQLLPLKEAQGRRSVESYLLLAITVLLAPWLWTHPLQSRETSPAIQGWSRSAHG